MTRDLYGCHYTGCDNAAASGGFCGIHEDYVSHATTTLDAERGEEQ